MVENTPFSTLKRILLVTVFAILGSPMFANQLEEKFRSHATHISEIAVFRSNDEYNLPRPPRTQRLVYDRAYLKAMHIPGSPDYPYEIEMTFRFEKDSGLPAADQAKNDQQIEVNLRGTWTDAEDDLKAEALIPRDVDLRANMKVLGSYSILSMEKVSFTGSRYADVDEVENKFIRNNDIYTSMNNDFISSYMLCQKDGSYRIPYCRLRLYVAPLTVRVTFQKHLVQEFYDVKEQATRFVNTIMADGRGAVGQISWCL